VRRLVLIVSMCSWMSTTLAAARAESPQVPYDAGVEFLEAGELDRAIENFQVALRIAPNLPQIHYMLGMANLQKSDLDSAVYYFEQAVDLKPDYAEAYGSLASTLAQQGEHSDLAIEYFEKAIEIQPSLAQPYAGVGWVYFLHEKDARKAAEYFEKSLRLDSSRPEAHYGLGLAYVTLGKRADALKPISMLRRMNREDLASAVEKKLQEDDEDIYEHEAAGQVQLG
jgi:tetratricopeptide (TPR) repeat protein